MAERFRRIGLVANTEKPASAEAVRRAVELIGVNGRRAYGDRATIESAGLQGVAASESVAALARQVDLLLVFGGDGTMLRAAREVAAAYVPLFGINLGGLGFLTGASVRRMPDALAQLWRGEVLLESRAMIEAHKEGRPRPLKEIALNDFVISRGDASRLIELEVSVDSQMLTRYRCDGLIVSTPTGSTAYSLAAGGAIVSPDAAVMTLTPICPHTLSNRSVIVSLDSTVAVRVLSRKVEVNLTADGQVQADLSSGDCVMIKRSRRQARLLRLAETNYFETLRQKLRWSGSSM